MGILPLMLIFWSSWNWSNRLKMTKKLNQTLFTANEAKALFAKQKKPRNHALISEESEQAELCKWVKRTYPKVLFTVDLGGIKLTPYQRSIMSTRAARGHPDMLFQEWNGIYCGLAIEFKKTGVAVANKDGTLRSDTHLSEQLDYLLALRERCYVAVFCCGLQAAKAVIAAYLEGGENSINIINQFAYPKT